MVGGSCFVYAVLANQESPGPVLYRLSQSNLATVIGKAEPATTKHIHHYSFLHCARALPITYYFKYVCIQVSQLVGKNFLKDRPIGFTDINGEDSQTSHSQIISLSFTSQCSLIHPKVQPQSRHDSVCGGSSNTMPGRRAGSCLAGL
jgi:hypothetical protein